MSHLTTALLLIEGIPVFVLVYVLGSAVTRAIGAERRAKKSAKIFRESSEGQMTKALDTGECPDCGSSFLIGGPCGGLSQNIFCTHCKREFCYCPGFTTSRIDRTPSDRLSIYGV